MRHNLKSYFFKIKFRRMLFHSIIVGVTRYITRQHSLIYCCVNWSGVFSLSQSDIPVVLKGRDWPLVPLYDESWCNDCNEIPFPVQAFDDPYRLLCICLLFVSSLKQRKYIFYYLSNLILKILWLIIIQTYII